MIEPLTIFKTTFLKPFFINSLLSVSEQTSGFSDKMSKSGTPYRGTEPIGFGGTYGAYPSAQLVGNQATGSSGAVSNYGSTQPPVQPVLNSSIVNIQGTMLNYVQKC